MVKKCLIAGIILTNALIGTKCTVSAADLPDSVVIGINEATANDISDSDIDLLARIVYHEAGNQDAYGKRLVAAVVLNRVDDPRFPATIPDVIYQRGQFTTAEELSRNDPPEDCYQAVLSEIADRSDTEVLFFNNNRNVYGTFLYQYGNHFFAK